MVHQEPMGRVAQLLGGVIIGIVFHGGRLPGLSNEVSEETYEKTGKVVARGITSGDTSELVTEIGEMLKELERE